MKNSARGLKRKKKKAVNTAHHKKKKTRIMKKTMIAAFAAIIVAIILGTCLTVHVIRPGFWSSVISKTLSVFVSNEDAESSSEDGKSREAGIDNSSENADDTNDENVSATGELPSDAGLSAIIGSGKAVSDALSNRPSMIELTSDNTAEFMDITSCEIDSATMKAKIVAQSDEGIPISDDKLLYLFNIPTYEDGISEDSEPIASVYKDTAAEFSADISFKKSDSRLYDKFTIAVKVDGKYVEIATPSYITNPEALASYNYSGMKHDSIKGLLIDPTKLTNGELEDLGVEYSTYNIPLSRILGSTSNSTYPTISYTYDGVTYNFNGAIIHEYDYLFEELNSKGIDIAAIILNNASTSAYPEITHPDARSGSTAPYRMFNASDESGVKAISAVAAFLADRYSGTGHGNVSMWVIANEVNARKEWNYMAKTDIATYTAAYTRAFRVFYNAIKSENAGAKVYISLDQQWDRNWSANPDYDGRDMLDLFASSLKKYGDIYWGLAYHPYSYPNDNTAFWKSSDLVTDSYDTSMITMKNIGVLTDYMGEEAMLDSDGNERSIILSEYGYTSTSGETTQAAAFAYAYYLMVKNGHIDAMMLSRQTDASEEISAYNLALGLDNSSGGHKYLYNVFKYIDTDQAAEYTSFAKDILGFSLDF